MMSAFVPSSISQPVELIFLLFIFYSLNFIMELSHPKCIVGGSENSICNFAHIVTIVWTCFWGDMWINSHVINEWVVVGGILPHAFIYADEMLHMLVKPPLPSKLQNWNSWCVEVCDQSGKPTGLKILLDVMRIKKCSRFTQMCLHVMWK